MSKCVCRFSQADCCCSIWITLSLALLAAAAAINITIVNPDRSESYLYQWRLCNTTAFRIDPSDLSGVLTFYAQSRASTCNWSNSKMFYCNGASDTVRCVIENTNLYNNPHWYCMLRCPDDDHIDCSAPVRFNQPAYCTGACSGMIVLYVFGGLIFLLSVIFGQTCGSQYILLCGER